MTRAIFAGVESQGLTQAKLISGKNHDQLEGVLDGRPIKVLGIPKTPGRRDDDKLVWKKGKDTMRYLRQSGESLTYWNR